VLGDNLTGDALLAYAAGIIDGEGSISIYHIPRDNGRKRCALRVIVGNTDPWLIRFLQVNFGGSVHCRHLHLRNPNHNDCWIWTATTTQAGQFLYKILPYLCLKRSQAEIALKWWERRRNTGHTLTDAEQALDEADRLLMLSCNSRKGKEVA